MATLASGGRLNMFGFVLRLAGRLPFLFIAGRVYGKGALGRFAFAVLMVEFGAQIAAFGLRRGLAQLLTDAKKPQACIVADALLIAGIGSLSDGDPAGFPDRDVSDHSGPPPRSNAAVTSCRLLDRHRAGRPRLSP